MYAKKPENCCSAGSKKPWIAYYGYKSVTDPIRWWAVVNDTDNVEDIIFLCVFGLLATCEKSKFLYSCVFQTSETGVCDSLIGCMQPFLL